MHCQVNDVHNVKIIVFIRLFWIDNGEVKSVKNDGSDLQTYFTVNHDKELLVYKVSFCTECVLLTKIAHVHLRLISVSLITKHF